MFRNFALVAFLVTRAAWPCASCGSGGDDPLILYPNESVKGFLGYQQTYNFLDITSKGLAVTSAAPTLRDQLTTALGVAFTHRSFATLTVPLLRNIASQTRASLGDPSLAARYTIVLPSIVDSPWIPQVQLIAGYRPSVATSFATSQDKYLLDVFGSGYNEAKAGLDVWFGRSNLKFGLALILLKPLSTTENGQTKLTGTGLRTTVSLGYQWDSFRTTLGLNREERSEIQIAETTLSDSDSVNHGFFVTQDWEISGLDRVRFSYSKQASLFSNKNTLKSDSLGVSYMRAF